VSYEIFFVRRDPGQSFEDALDDVEEGYEGDPGPLSEAELEQWDVVLPAACDLLGDVEQFGDRTTRELTHTATGIHLSLFNGEMAIRVPIGEVGGDRIDVMSKVYELARVVEKLTGLEGYDPQLQEPLDDGREGRPVPARRSNVDWDDEDDNEATGTNITLPVGRSRPDPEPSAGVSTARRWWEFWRR
jgi:hypothetical protein